MYIIYIFRTIVLIFVAMFITMFQPLYASSGGWNVELSPLFHSETFRGEINRK